MLQINQIKKSFAKNIVLNKIDISVGTNSNFCLLGKNGAGKTTLINIITDFVKPDSGEILFDNLKLTDNELEIKKNIGLLSEESFLIEELSGLEYLTLVAKLYKIPKKEVAKRIQSLFDYFFESILDMEKPISNYSTGMKKKLMFCSSVIHKPKFLILDEPFSGLDPVAANLLIEFLNRYKNNNRIIFLSSHNLNYIEKVATHIGVLDNGRLLFNGTLDSFIEDGNKNIDESLLSRLNVASEKIKGVEWAF